MTQKVGLIGWPVEHSVSPAMHNAAFRALGLDWRYDPLPVMPGEIGRRIDALIEAGYCGFNVTVPHKKDVLKLKQITEMDEAVETIGAANTITVLPNGSLRATNTDWRGFLDDLGCHGIEAMWGEALILGTGGSSQAIAYALTYNGVEKVRFVSRGQSKSPDVISYDEIPAFAPSADLVINCTPVGMWPNVESTPWPENLPFQKGAAVYDLIYNPPVTRFMEQAVSNGVRAISGLGMLVSQGAFSFEQWTGIKPPIKVMTEAAQRKLGIY